MNSFPDTEMAWFGKSWGSDLCVTQPHIDTPVGEECSHCGEKIEAGDDGIRYANGPVAHRNCFLRGFIGSVAHLERRCSCYVPGATCTDPPGLTRRQAADAAVKLYRESEKTLYDIARETCHEFRMTWTDPRTGIAYPPPEKKEP